MWQDFQFTSMKCSKTAATFSTCYLHWITTMSQSLPLRHSQPSWEDSHIKKKNAIKILVGQKVSLALAMTPYRKTRTNFLANVIQPCVMCETRETHAKEWNSAKEDTVILRFRKVSQNTMNVTVTDMKEWIGMQQEVKMQRTFQIADTPCKSMMCIKIDDQCSSAMCKWSVKSRLWCHMSYMPCK